MSRALGAADYGALAAVLNMLLVAVVPLAGVELAVAAATSRASRNGERTDPGSLLARALLAGVSVAALTVLLSGPLARSLRMPADVVAMAGVYLGLATIATPVRGMLLGAMRFVRMALAVGLTGIVKLGLGGWLLLQGGSLTTAMGVLLAAELAQLAALAWRNRWVWWRSRSGPSSKVVVSAAARSTAAVAGLWLLGTGDVVVARHLFVGDASGVYAAAGTAAHSLLFITHVVVQTMFPLLARSEGAELRRRFLSTVAVSVGLSGVVGVVMVAAPARVMGLLFGREFLAAAPLLGALVPATLAVAVVYVVAHLHLAAGNRAALVPWIGVTAIVLVAAFAPSTPRSLAWWMLIVSAGSALWAMAGAKRSWEDPVSGWQKMSSPPTCDVTVVVPFLDPGRRVMEVIGGILDQFEDREAEAEVIAVSDGSTDGSAEAVADMAAVDSRVRLIRFPSNRGKGAALRAGMVEARGKWIGFLDADGDIPPAVIGAFFDLADVYQPDAVVASKRHFMSRVESSHLRSSLSAGFGLITRVLFRLGVDDTQTGAKLVRREVLAAALPLTRETSSAFDLELLVAARAAGYRKLAEAPVTIRRKGSSTVSFRSVLEVGLATARITSRLVWTGYRRSSPLQSADEPTAAPVLVAG